LPNIIKIGQCLLKLQLKISGILFETQCTLITFMYNLIFRQNCGHSEGGFENDRSTIQAHIGMSTATPLLTLKVQCATWGRWKSISL